MLRLSVGLISLAVVGVSGMLQAASVAKADPSQDIRPAFQQQFADAAAVLKSENHGLTQMATYLDQFRSLKAEDSQFLTSRIEKAEEGSTERTFAVLLLVVLQPDEMPQPLALKTLLLAGDRVAARGILYASSERQRGLYNEMAREGTTVEAMVIGLEGISRVGDKESEAIVKEVVEKHSDNLYIKGAGGEALSCVDGRLALSAVERKATIEKEVLFERISAECRGAVTVGGLVSRRIAGMKQSDYPFDSDFLAAKIRAGEPLAIGLAGKWRDVKCVKALSAVGDSGLMGMVVNALARIGNDEAIGGIRGFFIPADVRRNGLVAMQLAGSGNEKALALLRDLQGRKEFATSAEGIKKAGDELEGRLSAGAGDPGTRPARSK